MSIHQEIEAKFTLPDRPTFDRLLSMNDIANFTCGDWTVQEIEDHYLDTPDRTMLAAGFAGRVRQKDDGWQLTLKSLGKIDGSIKRRKEFHNELGSKSDLDLLLEVRNWPAGPAQDWAQKVIGRAPLNVLFSLKQTRHLRKVFVGERAVADLCLDLVRFGEHSSSQVLEIELLPAGRESEFQQIIDVLAQDWPLLPSPLSKFERGLGLLDSSARLARLSVEEKANLEKVAVGRDSTQAQVAYLLLLWDAGLAATTIAAIMGGSKRRAQYWLDAFAEQRLAIFPVQSQPREKRAHIRPDDFMSQVGRKIFRFHFQRMLDHEPGTRLGKDIEELHDMRVATRRLRAAFRLFGPYFKFKVIRPHLKGLKRTGRALGPVRDLDVFEEKAQKYLASLPAEQSQALAPLLNVWHQQRIQARQGMLAYLDSKAYRRFVNRFNEFLNTARVGARPVPSGKPVPCQVRHVAPQLIHDRYETVCAYDTKLATASIEVLHALRIDLKHLRYTLEFFAPVLGPEARTVIRGVKAMQDHLGDLNDAHIAISLLHKFLAGKPHGQSGVLAYLQSRKEEKERLLLNFPAAWEHFKRPDLRQSLALAVSTLQSTC